VSFRTVLRFSVALLRKKPSLNNQGRRRWMRLVSDVSFRTALHLAWHCLFYFKNTVVVNTRNDSGGWDQRAMRLLGLRCILHCVAFKISVMVNNEQRLHESCQVNCRMEHLCGLQRFLS
jgi:hypothetical protein